jgi:hypothetical protein
VCGHVCQNVQRYVREAPLEDALCPVRHFDSMGGEAALGRAERRNLLGKRQSRSIFGPRLGVHELRKHWSAHARPNWRQHRTRGAGFGLPAAGSSLWWQLQEFRGLYLKNGRQLANDLKADVAPALC